MLPEGLKEPITLPELGAGDEPIHVSIWLVEVGEPVTEGDRIVEVRIPGVTFDVSAPCSGKVVEILVPASVQVFPGDVLGWIRAE